MTSPLLHAARTFVTGAALSGLVLGALVLDPGGTTASRQPGRSATSTSNGPSSAPSPAASSVWAPVAMVTHPKGRSWPGHPGRRVISYRVHRGDSATGIATRFHAWTAELLRINHKTSHSLWYVGEHVRVPVVTSRAHGHHVKAHHPKKRPTNVHHMKKHHVKKHHAHAPASPASRSPVRAEVIRVARHYGVRPTLALAIAWQESGWRQDVRSPAGAVGAMQVMPGTGGWISTLVGRRLQLRNLRDNVVAGVVLFKLLRASHGVRRSLAGYYQGIGSVQAHGLYPSTKRYVASVSSHWHRLDHGWHPLR